MRKFKAILALVLVAALFVTLFAACANTEKPSTDGGKDNTSNTDTNKEPAKDNEDKAPADDEAKEPVDPEEIIDVVLWIPDLNNAGGIDHCDRLEAYVNTITEPEGIHVDMTYLSLGEFRQKATMDIAAGEKIDLMCYWVGTNVLTMYNSKMAQPLDALLAEYAPGTVELMGDYMQATTFNGEIYSVPVLRNYVTNYYLCFNQDMLDQWGLTEQAKSMTSWSDFEAVLAAIHENVEPGVYAFVPWGGSAITNTAAIIRGDKFSDTEVMDNLGDGTGTAYVSPDGKVSLWQADEAYVTSCLMAKKWMDNGWSWPDALYDTNTSATEIIGRKAGVSEYAPSEEGITAWKTGTFGAQALCVRTSIGNIKTSTMTSWGMGIPISAQEPEAAMQLLEMMYTTDKLMKALVNGVEGEDYVLVDGQAQVQEGGYNMGNYVIGNNLLAYPAFGNGADFYEKVNEANKAASLSPFMGFVLITDELQDYIANITAVTDQYRTGLQAGGFDEDLYNEYLSKLETAGVNDYLAGLQAQLDAWLASK